MVVIITRPGQGSRAPPQSCTECCGLGCCWCLAMASSCLPWGPTPPDVCTRFPGLWPLGWLSWAWRALEHNLFYGVNLWKEECPLSACSVMNLNSIPSNFPSQLRPILWLPMRLARPMSVPSPSPPGQRSCGFSSSPTRETVPEGSRSRMWRTMVSAVKLRSPALNRTNSWASWWLADTHTCLEAQAG